MIRIFIFTLCLICFKSFLFSEAMTEEEWKISLKAEKQAQDEYIPYMNEIRDNVAKQVYEEFNLHGYGGRGMNHEKIETFGMNFVASRRASLEEARALHLAVLERFVQAVNNHQKIQSFLEVQPFSYQRAIVSISFARKDHREFADGSISDVSNVSGNANAEANRNKLIYYSTDPFRESSIDRFSESYEDAVKLAAESPVKNLAVHEGNEKEELMDQLLDAFVHEMKDLKVYYRDIGGKFFIGDVKEIGGSFDVFHKANQQDARQLVLHMTERLLEMVNKQEKLRPYLDTYPFLADRIKIKISFRDKRYESYYDGSITYVRLENGKIAYEKYDYYDKNDRFSGYSFVFDEEPYEDALKQIETPPRSIKKFNSILQISFSILSDVVYAIIDIFGKLLSLLLFIFQYG